MTDKRDRNGPELVKKSYQPGNVQTNNDQPTKSTAQAQETKTPPKAPRR